MHLTVCSCHVTDAFQGEFTLYSCLNVKQLFARSSCEMWRLSDCNWTRTQNHLPWNEHLNIWPNWQNDWPVFWVHICRVHLMVCSCHVTNAFQIESTLYSCLNVEELPPQSTRKIWRLSDCNWTRTQKHLLLKRTLNYLAKLDKWLSCEYLIVFKWFLGIFISTVHLTLCFWLVTYPFQSESTLCSYVNVKELLARNMGKIWRLSKRKWTRT